MSTGRGSTSVSASRDSVERPVSEQVILLLEPPPPPPPPPPPLLLLLNATFHLTGGSPLRAGSPPAGQKRKRKVTVSCAEKS